MVYGDIQKVRRLAGQRPQKAYDVSIGEGDGSNTEFELLYVGRNAGFVLDQDASQSVDLDKLVDITVYVDDVAVTVSSIDNEKGTVVLASAPDELKDVTADYWHSEVSDEMVLESMEDAELGLNEIIDGKIGSTAGIEFKYDGNGVDSEFTMKKSDVTAITGITVNGSSKTLNSDYFAYYYDDGIRIEYIKFNSPPSSSTLQNIVMTVTRGISATTNKNLVRLADLMSARSLLLDLPDSAIIGEFKKGSEGTGKTPTSSRLRMINSEIANILDKFDRRNILA